MATKCFPGKPDFEYREGFPLTAESGALYDTRKPRRFTTEFKTWVLDLVFAGSIPAAQISRTLDIPYITLSSWVANRRANSFYWQVELSKMEKRRVEHALKSAPAAV